MYFNKSFCSWHALKSLVFYVQFTPTRWFYNNGNCPKLDFFFLLCSHVCNKISCTYILISNERIKHSIKECNILRGHYFFQGGKKLKEKLWKVSWFEKSSL